MELGTRGRAALVRLRSTARVQESEESVLVRREVLERLDAGLDSFFEALQASRGMGPTLKRRIRTHYRVYRLLRGKLEL